MALKSLDTSNDGSLTLKDPGDQRSSSDLVMVSLTPKTTGVTDTTNDKHELQTVSEQGHARSSNSHKLIKRMI